MKYGESAFDIAYLLFAVICGVVILRRARTRGERTMGLAALILGCGADAGHADAAQDGVLYIDALRVPARRERGREVTARTLDTRGHSA